MECFSWSPIFYASTEVLGAARERSANTEMHGGSAPRTVSQAVTGFPNSFLVQRNEGPLPSNIYGYVRNTVPNTRSFGKHKGTVWSREVKG